MKTFNRTTVLGLLWYSIIFYIFQTWSGFNYSQVIAFKVMRPLSYPSFKFNANSKFKGRIVSTRTFLVDIDTKSWIVKDLEEITGVFQEIEDAALPAINILEDAALPSNGEDLISIFVSETVAGFFSGFSSQIVATAVGDKKKDTNIVQSTAAGAYFGVRGVVRNVAQVLGIPKPIAAFLAGVTASILSEEVIYVGRQTAGNNIFNTSSIDENDNTITTAIAMKKPGNNVTKKQPLISLPELTQDVAKWVAYDLLSPSQTSPLSGAIVGLLSGFISHTLYEIILFSINKDTDGSSVGGNLNFKSFDIKKISKEDAKIILSRILKAGLEGATLFACYETTRGLFDNFLPSDLKKVLSINFSDIAEKIWYDLIHPQ